MNNTVPDGTIILNPVTGEFEFADGTGDTITLTTDFFQGRDYSINYEESFERKRQALYDIVNDGGNIRRDEVADLVLAANKALEQYD